LLETKEIRNLLNNKDSQIEELEKSLKSNVEELQRKIIEEVSSKKQVQAKVEELKHKITEKEFELNEIKAVLIDKEKQLLMLRSGGFWQRLIACFRRNASFDG
jgi:selenophosphate synthetase-related protein